MAYEQTPLLNAGAWGRAIQITASPLTPTFVDAAVIIQNAIDAVADTGGVVYLEPGRYYVASTISIPSGVELIGAGKDKTFIVASTDLAGAAAPDTATNAFLTIAGDLATGAGTTSTLNGAVAEGFRLVTTAAALTEVSAGDWVYVSGNNAASNSQGDSDGPNVILKEMMPVLDRTTVTITVDRVRQYHATGLTIQKVVPVSNVRVRGITFEMDNADPNFAVGIYIAYATDIYIEDCSGSGFSRSFINATNGARRIYLDGIRNDGNNNACVYFDSVIDGQNINMQSKYTTTRYNSTATSITRGMFTLRNRNTNIFAQNLELAHACLGIQCWGGNNITIDNVRAWNLDVNQAYDSMAMYNELNPGNTLGIVFDGGASPLDYAEFGHCIKLTNVQSSGLIPDLVSGNWKCAAIYWHDHLDSTLSNIDINQCAAEQASDTGNTTYRLMRGIVLSDTYGVGSNWMIRGCIVDIEIENFYADLRIHSIRINSTDAGTSPSSAMNGAVPIKLDNQTGGLIFHGVTVTGAAPMVRFGNSWGGSNCRIELHDVQFDTYFAPFAIASYNSGGALTAGQAAEFVTGANVPSHQPCTAASIKNCSPVNAQSGNDPTTGWQIVAVLPVTCGYVRLLCTTAAVVVGDLIVASATSGYYEANNAPGASHHVVGKAITAKGAGSTGTVLVVGA